MYQGAKEMKQDLRSALDNIAVTPQEDLEGTFSGRRTLWMRRWKNQGELNGHDHYADVVARLESGTYYTTLRD